MERKPSVHVNVKSSEQSSAYPVTVVGTRSSQTQRTENVRKRPRIKIGTASHSPIRHFRSNLHPPKLDASAVLGGNTRALDRVNDRPSRDIADGAAGTIIGIRIEHALSFLNDVPTVSAGDVEGAAGDVVYGAVKDGLHSDIVRGESGHDIEIAVLNVGVVARVGGHFEFAVPKNR